MTFQLSAITGSAPGYSITYSKGTTLAGGTTIARGFIILNRPSLRGWCTLLSAHSAVHWAVTVPLEEEGYTRKYTLSLTQLLRANATFIMYPELSQHADIISYQLYI